MLTADTISALDDDYVYHVRPLYLFLILYICTYCSMSFLYNSCNALYGDESVHKKERKKRR